MEKEMIEQALDHLDEEEMRKLRRRAEEALRKMPHVARRVIADMIARGEIRSDIL